jgi:hypothetical protein
MIGGRPMQSAFPILAVLFAALLGVGIFALLVIGRTIGRRRAAAFPEDSHTGLGAVDGAVFGLLGLLIAFTFSGAALRFEERRVLIVTETNDIGTAWLRIDLLSSDDQPQMRTLFRQYLDARLATYADASSVEHITAANQEALARQDAIWKLAVAAVYRPGSAAAAAMLLLPALNAMFDTAEMRRRVTTHHPPAVIYLMLAILAMVGALVAGYGMYKGPTLSLTHTVGFALVLAATVYVIVNLEYPRLGFIGLETADQALVDLRRSMN